MAHNINYNKKTKKHAMYSRKEIPWHGLGQVVETALTSQEAIVEAGLDYNVIKCPTFARFPSELNPPSKGDKVPSTFATVRTDTWDVLGAVGNRYEIVQNADAFDFIDDIVGSREAIFETAGALNRGERIFVTAKLPNNIRMANTDDVIEQYIMFTNTHDGSGSVVAGFTPIRVVCNNTLNVALSGIQNKVTFRHTINVKDRLSQGREMLGLYRVYSEEFAETIKHLANVKIKEEHVDILLKKIVFSEQEIKLISLADMYIDEISTRKRNKFIDLKTYVEDGVGQELHRGSALWIYNGVTSYYSNAKEYKSKEDRFDGILNGMGQKDSQRVFNEVLTLI